MGLGRVGRVRTKRADWALKPVTIRSIESGKRTRAQRNSRGLESKQEEQDNSCTDGESGIKD